jgi:hypothetical protein
VPWCRIGDPPLGLLLRRSLRRPTRGTTNQCVFLDTVDDGKTLWVAREYVWDSKKLK